MVYELVGDRLMAWIRFGGGKGFRSIYVKYMEICYVGKL